jgi:tetratricopeptide (TPR) repeat protein
VSRDGARSAAEANLLPLPKDALIFATTNWFPFRYLQDVEGMRPDVTILLQGDLARPEFFTPVTVKRFPRVLIPSREEIRGKSYPFFQSLLRKNLGRAPIYWEPMDVLTPNVAVYLRPWRYLWRFDPTGKHASTSPEVETYLSDMRVFLSDQLDSPVSLPPRGAPRFDARLLADRQRRIYHAYLLAQSAEVFKFQDRTTDAVTLTELALQLTPDNPKLSNDLGQLYSRLNQWDQAERMFGQAIRLAPKDATPLVNLAILR